MVGGGVAVGGRVGVGFFVLVGVGGWGVFVRLVGMGVTLGIGVFVQVGMIVSVGMGVLVHVAISVSVGMRVRVGVRVGIRVGVRVGNPGGRSVSVLGIRVGLEVRVIVGVTDGVNVRVAVGVPVSVIVGGGERSVAVYGGPKRGPRVRTRDVRVASALALACGSMAAETKLRPASP